MTYTNVSLLVDLPPILLMLVQFSWNGTSRTKWGYISAMTKIGARFKAVNNVTEVKLSPLASRRTLTDSVLVSLLAHNHLILDVSFKSHMSISGRITLVL